MMLELKHFLVFMSWTAFVECQGELFIVGGKKAKIENFPHSVYLKIVCVDKDKTREAFQCGASIVNELIILTAAHCVVECSYGITLKAYMGHVKARRGFKSSVRNIFPHPKYIPDKPGKYDIALAKLKTPIKFGNKTKRLAFMANPPYFEKAQVAGWGLINEVKKKDAKYLMFIDQWVKKSSYCSHILKHKLPIGTICVGCKKSKKYASRGDSGSALVVQGYIQIGIVSYKIPSISRSLVIYTDTGYFYNWIVKNAIKLYCAK